MPWAPDEIEYAKPVDLTAGGNVVLNAVLESADIAGVGVGD